MPEARTAEEIQQELLASVTAQTDLYDPEEASRIRGLMGSAAMQFEQSDALTVYLTQAFGLNVFGQALDDRVAQIPGFEPRRPASPSQGAVMRFTFDTSVGTSTVPVGTLFAAGEVTFVLVTEVTRLSGETTYPAAGQDYGYVVCSQPGTEGNVAAGSIVTVVSDVEDLLTCSNVVSLNNGMTRESDQELQLRALNYYAGGLGRVSPPGLIALALAFVSSTGTRCRHARVREFPDRPYSEIIVDDGLGFTGAERSATIRSGTIPQNGQLDFWFDFPTVEDEVVLQVNDGGGFQDKVVQWTTLNERGRAWLDEGSTIFQPGYLWQCTGHHCYIDWIAEFQAVIEATLQYLGRAPGYRATGVRVRAVRPVVEWVEYTCLLVVASGFAPATVYAQVRTAIATFHLNLAPGEPLLMLDMYATLARIEGVENIHLVDRDDEETPMGDVYPSGDNYRLSVNAATGILINGSLA